jgi:DNA-3-methyladenine glycosylase II
MEDSLALTVVPPFRLDFTVWALRRRKTNIVDLWDGSKYTRVIAYNGDDPLKITIGQQGTINHPQLIVALQSKNGGEEITAANVQKDVGRIIQKMLGLDRDLTSFYTLAKNNKDDLLVSLGQQYLGVKPPCFPSIFETLINAIACQQVTLDLGILMLNRLAENFGVEFEDEDDDGGGDGEATPLHAFPRPEDLADVSEQDLRKLGFSRQKARAIRELAMICVADNNDNNEVQLDNLGGMSNEQIVEQLSAIRGIGRWSAEYALLRGFGRIDSFPGDDIGAQNNLKQLFHLDKKPDYAEVKKLTSRWHPYEGLVYFHLLLNKLRTRGII